jgi:uncharacterized protein (DUF924 family)
VPEQGEIGRPMADDDSNSSRSQIAALLDYWFAGNPSDAAAVQALNRRWFISTPAQDRELTERFGGLAQQAAAGRLEALAGKARGRLALIVLLDQLPRNLHRGTARAFAQDRQALAHCLAGLDRGEPDELAVLERVIFCMPLQHAESPAIQAQAVATFARLAESAAPPAIAAALANFADYAVRHRDIIARFGRFPHRNAVLGRRSTAAEIAYLQSGASSFGQ